MGIGRLMGRAGLTHGGFYAHFQSKEALVGEALALSLDATSQRLADTAAAPPYGLSAVVRSYVSRTHRDHPESEGSCILPTLVGEVARQPASVRQEFTETLDELVRRFGALSRLPNEPERRAEVLAMLSGMVGAVALARAVSDPELSDEILQATRQQLLRALNDA